MSIIAINIISWLFWLSVFSYMDCKLKQLTTIFLGDNSNSRNNNIVSVHCWLSSQPKARNHNPHFSITGDYLHITLCQMMMLRCLIHEETQIHSNIWRILSFLRMSFVLKLLRKIIVLRIAGIVVSLISIPCTPMIALRLLMIPSNIISAQCHCLLWAQVLQLTCLAHISNCWSQIAGSVWDILMLS